MPGDRRPLRASTLRSAVLHAGSIWSGLEVVAQTGSTNEDLLAAARAGASEGTVLVAEQQTRGRGRLGRTWVAQPGTALTFSVLLRPVTVPRQAMGWLPLLTGVAVARALTAGSGVEVTLKWPNDVLAGGAKLAGILAEQAGDAVVVGAGINVTARPDELPPAGATSLAQCGATSADREALLVAVLQELQAWYLCWTARDPGAGSRDPGDADASGLRAEYLRWCSTIGRDVRVQLPGGPPPAASPAAGSQHPESQPAMSQRAESRPAEAPPVALLTGVASGIDQFGRLIVDAAAGAVPVSAGDVIHVR